VFLEPDGDALTLSVDTPLLHGFSLNTDKSTATRLVFDYNGSALVSGDFFVTIRATDSFGAFTTITEKIHVSIGIDHGFVGGGDGESPLISASEPAPPPPSPP
jgi:hypothetical protein